MSTVTEHTLFKLITEDSTRIKNWNLQFIKDHQKTDEKSELRKALSLCQMVWLALQKWLY